MVNKNEGVCRFCLKWFSGRAMGRHIEACADRKQANEKAAASGKSGASIYHIRVSGYPPFWLHLEMPSQITLDDLDAFLRGIWLECCGHLSQFTIQAERYSAPFDDGWDEMESQSTDISLNSVLDVKSKFEYEYDFGSTTHLEGQVIAERVGVVEEGIKIMARNDPPDTPCEDCDAEATQICTECWDLYCDRCLEEHGCGADMSLPVVNSPRMGVCGYTGNQGFDRFVIPIR